MSMSQTYNLARTVRAKFQDQAAVKDHNLRILVAHANLYDDLLAVLSQEQQVAKVKPEQVDPRVVHIENVARERRKRNIRFAATSHPRHQAATENTVKSTPVAISAGRRDQLREAYSVVSVDELEVSDEEEEDDSEEEDDASLESSDSLPEIYYESDSEEESEWDEDQEYYDDFDDLDDCDVHHCSYTPETILQIARDLEVSKLNQS